MAIELRILTGARAGQTEWFDKDVIAIGRHPTSDFLLDVKKDLDVSRRHGEIRQVGAGYRLYDKDSTNGTFVNDEQVAPGGNRDLRSGDKVRFGAQGPTVAVVFTGATTDAIDESSTDRSHAADPFDDDDDDAPGPRVTPPATGRPSLRERAAARRLEAELVVERPIAERPIAERPIAEQAIAERPMAEPSIVEDQSAKEPVPIDVTAEPVTAKAPARQPTIERVAIAVKQQTYMLRIVAFGAVVILGGLAGGLLWSSRQASAEHNVEIQQLLAANEEMTRQFQTRRQAKNDTGLTNAMQRRLDSLFVSAREARDQKSVAAAQQRLRENHDLQRKFNAMDLTSVRDANDAGVALIISEIEGRQKEATGFSVNPAGLIVTNRHVVTDTGNTRASKISVKFANTREWRHAHLVKLDDNAEVDLALIQIDEPGVYPAVRGVARSVDTPVGAAIATIGFPLGTDTPMEGNGNNFAAKTSLTIGTVSKSVTDVLQIDAFASHGSSGSPVVDSHGHVIGVVWGGPPNAAGRIVYAVPADKISALLDSVK
jgi:S1-C subfamily serine protease/pSer/pThr/pTyr-binding forkhead associated (FHA) protein